MDGIKHIQGHGGGGGSQHTPVEMPDDISSTDSFRILDLISEGEIMGLVNGTQSVFFDQTPMTDVNANDNFPGATVQTRTGTPNQTVIKGFNSAENTISVNVQLKHGTPWVQALGNTQISAVGITIGIPRLEKQNVSNGDTNGTSVAYTIELSTDGGAYATVVNGTIHDKTTTAAHREHRIDLPDATTGWSVRVTRLTMDSTSQTLSNDTNIVSYTEIVDGDFTYPNCALVAVTGNAKQFSNIPQRAYDMWGLIVRVPSNYDPKTRAYTGTWDGTFIPKWTDNPAWVFYDLVTADRYGLGKFIDEALIDKYALYTIGKYCDELVDDGNGGTEPRFSCNCYIQQANDAYKVLNDLVSVFRGMMYWQGGAVVAHGDAPSDPAYTFTNANVIDGKFTYQSSARTDRYTVANVSWNDPQNFMHQRIETVEYQTGIDRYGWREKDVTGFACTSQGQAQRLGRWITQVACELTNTVTFDVGLEGLRATPGDVINVADAHRMGKRQGGRIHSATADTVTLDAAADVVVGDTLSVNMPDGTTQSRDVIAVSGLVVTVHSGTSGTAFSAAPAAQSVWSVTKSSLVPATFRVMGITENNDSDSITFTITAVAYNASIYGSVEQGLAITKPPFSALRPKQPVAPGGLTLTAANVTHHGASTVQVTIAWGHVDGANGYDAQYRIEDGPWIDAGVDIASATVDFYNARAGSYDARVRSVDASGNRSQWTQLDDATLVSGPTAYFSGGTLAGDKIASDVGTDTIASQTYVQGELAGYVTAVAYDNGVAGLQSQIDGEITSWFGKYDPSSTSEPENDWTTTALKDRHLGDTFTNIWNGTDASGSGTAGGAWRYAKSGASYVWSIITDTATTKALALAGAAQDTADGKRRVFVSTPTAPYDVGDLWAKADDSIWVATVARTAVQSYTAADWVKKGDVTADNTAADVQTGSGKAVAEPGADKTSANQSASTATISNHTQDDLPAGPNYGRIGLPYLDGAGNLTSFYGADNNLYRIRALAALDKADYGADVSGTKPPADADNTAASAQASSWLTDTTNLARGGDSITRFGGRTLANIDDSSRVLQPGANLMPNPSGALGISEWGTIGSPVGFQSIHASDGWQYRFAMPATAATVGAYYALTVIGSGTYTFSADVYYDGLAAGTFVFDAAGSGFDAGGFNDTAPHTWHRVSWTFTVPAGTTSMDVRFFLQSGSGTGLVAFRRIKVELGSVATPFDDAATQFGNRLTVAASNQRLGDSRNSPAFGTASFGGAWGSGSLSYSGSASSMTLSADSLQLYNGNWQPTYNAASTTVSGTAGSTKDYYLYYDDAAQAGGSQTLHATTDQTVLAQSDGRVTVGEMAVTFPSSGTGGGSGSASCVREDSWLYVQRDGAPQFIRAKELVPIRRGDMIRAVNPATGIEWWQQMTAAALATNDGVRVTCANGAQLDCSVNADLGGADGARVRADTSDGKSLYTRAGTSAASVQSIGTITVVQIMSGGVFFLAGMTQSQMLAHHNLKPLGPP